MMGVCNHCLFLVVMFLIQPKERKMKLKLATILVFTSLVSNVYAEGADCLSTLLSKKTEMWWQGVNPGSPRNVGFAEFKLIGASDPENAIFKGRFGSGSSIYNIEKGKISGNTFTFETTTFDRPGATGRESRLVGSGKCGLLGNLGKFEYQWARSDHDDDRPLYKYDFLISAD